MDFLILNRKEISSFSHPSPYVVISITEPYDDHPKLPDDKNLVAALRIKFPDADMSFEWKGSVVSPMNENHARRIISFIKDIVLNNTDRNITTIVCQCDGGISRSSAVAAALCKIFCNSDAFVFDNPKYKPNMYVYRMILTEFFMNYNVESEVEPEGAP